ncbi:ATP-binding cassette domain-containing protein [Ovoidimarina sediminis]|uniref:ATP-binding cassette domain-containing protein n=1 Tax=Ovoidimarina sediminis TaxID=3079856 RepID=UPI002910E6DB|nr:ATP-binding cassette domain-containing protein [Rhodophyticola sp. MJ-SS7]MDU8942044.1 ATP-binding cassette domain-containing protein [Rhodophyticola sp. MJ-SS7]
MVSRCLPLTLRGVELRRQGRTILGPIDWTLEGDGITVLMGPNGSGKTSLLRAMHGLERINRGELKWSGDEAEVRRAQAFVFQTPILMRRSIVDCIAYPLRLDGVSMREARRQAEGAAEQVGLSGALDRPSEVLSGGEKQKMALARALIRKPELLFLDEPCANLDGASTRDIEEILRSARDAGTRIVMSTHDIGQARRLADEILFLHGGHLLDAAHRDAFFGGEISRQATAHLNGELIP